MSFKRSRAAFEADANGPPPHAPYAWYGTPLPAYDLEARDDGSYVPVWKQEVTDEHGRKRLHGAFTGGWSAGYFNTVGSKEGWTPSTFVSSRSNRAKDQNGKPREQRAEDFMDEEDLAEQAESQKIETQHAFAGLGSSSGDATSKGMFADLFRASGETKGIKLLQRMGWRQGQGIGPKVRRRAKGDDKGEVHLFAPENSRMIGFEKKVDRKGLGFVGEDRLGGSHKAPDDDDNDDESGEDARILRVNRTKALIKPKQLKKSGLGVGVLNDDGSDDEDPYSVGPRINYNRIIVADKKKKKLGLTAPNSNQSNTKTTSAPRKLAQRVASVSEFRKCHDGRLPLDGFVLSTATIIVQENEHPPPDVPDDWRPARENVITAADKRSAYQSTADAAKASKLDPASRAALLGEQQLPGKSIFDLISPADRDRLATLTGRKDLPPGRGEKLSTGDESAEGNKPRTLWDLVPSLDKQTAMTALQRGARGWMPYSEDKDKQSRYKHYLELSAGLQSVLPERPQTFTRDEWAKELREFAEAAEIFKPMSGLMATRFTSSTNAPKLASDAPDPPSTTQANDEDPAEKAARMGMYGPLTRSRQAFYPSRLLCKRFNVKPPANVGRDPTDTPGADGEAVDPARRLDIVSQADLDRMMLHANLAPAGFNSGGNTEGSEDAPRNVEQTKAPNAEVDVERNDALEGQKAGEAIFKAIFGSDDEDD